MAPPTSFFSRARPGKAPPPRKIHGFMSLPGEIRNMIYTYYFAPNLRCEFIAQDFQFHSTKKCTVKLWSGFVHSEDKIYKYEPKARPEQLVTIRISRPLGKYTLVKGLNTNWMASHYALNLVSKQIYAETSSFLYNKTVFLFDAPKRINGFLVTVPQAKLHLITKLQVHYNAYADPQHNRDRIWQDKHIESWSQACKSASKNLTALKSLEIWVHHPDSSPRFNLREKWLAPLLQFRRLTRTLNLLTSTSSPSSQALKSLEEVRIHLRTRLSDILQGRFGANPDLVNASTDLHLLFGQAISLAVLGAKEEVAMAGFNEAWEGKYAMWKHHLRFAKTGW